MKKNSDYRTALMAKKSNQEVQLPEPYKEMVETEVENKNGTSSKQVTFETEPTCRDYPKWEDTTLKGMKDGGVDIENRPMSPAFFQQAIDSMDKNLKNYEQQLDYLKSYAREQENKSKEQPTEQKGE